MPKIIKIGWIVPVPKNAIQKKKKIGSGPLKAAKNYGRRGLCQIFQSIARSHPYIICEILLSFKTRRSTLLPLVVML